MQQIKQWLTYLIILTFPVMSIVTFPGGAFFNAALSDILIVLLGIVYLIDIRNFRFKKNFPHWWYFAAFTLAMALSAFAAYKSSDINNAGIKTTISEIGKFLIVAVYFFIGYNSFNDKKQLKRILQFWIGGLWFTIISGIIVLAGHWLGKEITWNKTLGAVGRFMGGFTDPNLAGTYLSLSFFIVLI